MYLNRMVLTDGQWNSVFKRFRRWVKRGAFERIFKALSEDSDFEYVMVDGTIVRVHRHGQGAKGGPKIRPSGKAGGGLTTKILALVDALGNLVRFRLIRLRKNSEIQCNWQKTPLRA